MSKEKKQPDTYSYKGWLRSDKFIKRALAVYGHTFVGGLLIIIPIYIVFFLISLIIFLVSKTF